MTLDAPRARARVPASKDGRHPVRAPRNSPAAMGGQAGRPTENVAESPLAWLRRRQSKTGETLINEAQFAAGERLRADFWFAHMTPRTTSSWSEAASHNSGRRSAPGAGVDLQDHVIAAQQRVHRALAAVGPELSGILIDVCCHLKGLEDAERLAGWPRRAGKTVLQLALSSLARHYGIKHPDDGAGSGGSGAPARVRHWGAADYRPVVGE